MMYVATTSHKPLNSIFSMKSNILVIFMFAVLLLCCCGEHSHDNDHEDESEHKEETGHGHDHAGEISFTPKIRNYHPIHD